MLLLSTLAVSTALSSAAHSLALTCSTIFVAWAEEVVTDIDDGSETNEVVDDGDGHWPATEKSLDEVEVEEADEAPVETTYHEEGDGETLCITTLHRKRVRRLLSLI